MEEARFAWQPTPCSRRTSSGGHQGRRPYVRHVEPAIWRADDHVPRPSGPSRSLRAVEVLEASLSNRVAMRVEGGADLEGRQGAGETERSPR